MLFDEPIIGAPRTRTPTSARASTDAPAFVFELRASPIVTGAIIAAHGATLVPLWLTGIEPWIAAIVSLLVVAHGAGLAWRYGALRSRRSVVAIGLMHSHAIVLIRNDGSRAIGNVEPSTVVTGRLAAIVVRLASVAPEPEPEPDLRPGSPDPDMQSGRRLRHSLHRHRLRHRTAIVAADMLGDEEFRRLRVLLMWGEQGAGVNSRR